MSNHTITSTANPNCEVCRGTGTDEAFGSDCSECWIDADRQAMIAARYEGVRTGNADRFHRPGDRLDGRTFGSQARSDEATPKQIALIETLISERPADHPHVQLAVTRLNEGIDKGKAKQIISHLIEKVGKVEVARTEQADTDLDLTSLPAGRYAVAREDGSHLKVQIDVVEDSGKWNGWVFVKDANSYGKQQRYGSQRPGQNYRGKITAQLATILADPKSAAAAYGKATNTCGMCGRKLEDEKNKGRDGLTSVERGIGPVCAEKF